MSLLVPAYPGCPGSKAVKRSLLLIVKFIKTNKIRRLMGTRPAKEFKFITVNNFITINATFINAPQQQIKKHHAKEINVFSENMLCQKLNIFGAPNTTALIW